MRLYLRDWRKHRGLTLEQLGALVGKEKNTISRWERGLLNLNVDDLPALADALVCTPYDLLYRSPDDEIDIVKVWTDASEADREALRKVAAGFQKPDSPPENHEKSNVVKIR